MSKGARLREQRRVQAPQKRGRRPQTPRPPGASGMSRRTLYIGVIAGVALIAIVLIGASVLSSGTKKSPKTAAAPTAAATNKLLAGIPQHGAVLGSPKAPVTMYEFADLQCPGCDQYMLQAFPDIVTRYVRTGKVQVHFKGISFIGPDSETALRYVLAAGQQNRLWNAAEILYRNQGTENTGWVTNKLLNSVTAGIPGLSAAKIAAAKDSKAINRQMAANSAAFTSNGFQSTPGFMIGPTGGTLTSFSPSAYSVDAFGPQFDKILAQHKQ